LLDSEQLKKRAKNMSIKAENAVQYADIGQFFNAEWRIFRLVIFVHQSSNGLELSLPVI
jgi:hypothetical protein